MRLTLPLLALLSSIMLPAVGAGEGGPMTVAMKAKAAEHWAFQALREPALPAVKDAAWPANAVDHFVLAALEAEGLHPSPAADRRTLIRRAYLDLIGLPPTPEEVAAFVADASPQAFAAVVDGLLARPQYGERWGRFWLDVARYADTRGLAKQRATSLNPNAWTYRDYVIGAFNQDLPFDQFIREQIAADLLPERAGDASLAALGFLTQGDQFMGNRQDILNDQIDVVTKGFLGLTVTCARCHDHAFDPIPQADYYALHGIFNSSVEPEGKPQVVAAGPRSEDYQVQREEILRRGRAKLMAEMNRNAALFNRHARVFLQLAALDRQSPERLAFLKQQQLDARVLGELGNLLRFRLSAKRGEALHPVLVPLRRLLAIKPADFAKAFPAWQAQLARQAPRLPSNAAVRQAFAVSAPATQAEALDCYAAVFEEAGAAYQREFAAWKQAGGRGLFPGLADASLEEVRTAVADPGFFRSGGLAENQRALPRAVQFLVSGLNADLARLDVSHPGAPGLANVLADAAEPRSSALLRRGQVQNPGPVVPRQFLEFLSGPARLPYTEGSGRRQLAEAIASPSNPLTPRVLVNRVWQHHFSEGFVATPDDLGVMSAAPSHPALLDYLAARFVQDGWSIKQLHRTILLSKTWQQSSQPDPAQAARDPFNRLLWRQHRHRLDFEAFRDSLLFMGGQLDLTLGGHPVNIESEPYSQRRSVYGFIDRNEMAEFLRHFDVANAQLPTGRRFETIVPQQALFRMNSLLVIEQARHLVARADVQAATSDEARVQKLYEIIYQRGPEAKELALGLDYVRRQPPALAASARPDSAELGPQSRRALGLQAARAGKTGEKRPKQEAPRPSRANKEAVRDPGAAPVDRRPLSPWEKYAQALLMTSEMAYVN